MMAWLPSTWTLQVFLILKRSSSMRQCSISPRLMQSRLYLHLWWASLWSSIEHYHLAAPGSVVVIKMLPVCSCVLFPSEWMFKVTKWQCCSGELINHIHNNNKRCEQDYIYLWGRIIHISELFVDFWDGNQVRFMVSLRYLLSLLLKSQHPGHAILCGLFKRIWTWMLIKLHFACTKSGPFLPRTWYFMIDLCKF